MQRIICCVLVVLIVSGLAVGAGIERSEPAESRPSEDALFAEAQGKPVCEAELELVEGEGLLGAVGGFVTGFLSGVVGYGVGQAVDTVTTGRSNPSLRGMFTSALYSGVLGAIAGGIGTGPI